MIHWYPVSSKIYQLPEFLIIKIAIIVSSWYRIPELRKILEEFANILKLSIGRNHKLKKMS